MTARRWRGKRLDSDDGLAPEGRVFEVLSEQLCQGWLKGYLLTGRHGVFSTYEAFAHIVDSMVVQHAKWLHAASEIPWRAPIPSLNYLITSHVWRQDHNGATHQDPGCVDHVLSKRPEVSRVYLPPDANCLLHVFERCLRGRGMVNVVVVGKHSAPQYLSDHAARAHCERGLSVWNWAGSDQHGATEVVLACAGDVPTQETLAAHHRTASQLTIVATATATTVVATRNVREPGYPAAGQVVPQVTAGLGRGTRCR